MPEARRDRDYRQHRSGWTDAYNTPYSNRYADYFHRAGGGLMSGPSCTRTSSRLCTIARYHHALVVGVVAVVFVPRGGFGHAFFRMGLGAGLAVAWCTISAGRFSPWPLPVWLLARRDVRYALLGAGLLGGIRVALASFSASAASGQVAPIAQALEMDPDDLRLGGESRVITVLFVDIRGFTDFRNGMPHPGRWRV